MDNFFPHFRNGLVKLVFSKMFFIWKVKLLYRKMKMEIRIVMESEKFSLSLSLSLCGIKNPLTHEFLLV